MVEFNDDVNKLCIDEIRKHIELRVGKLKEIQENSGKIEMAGELFVIVNQYFWNNLKMMMMLWINDQIKISEMNKNLFEQFMNLSQC